VINDIDVYYRKLVHVNGFLPISTNVTFARNYFSRGLMSIFDRVVILI